MGDDVLKITFKALKQKGADYSDVINTQCSECCQSFLQAQDLGPSDTAGDLSTSTSCTVYSHPDYPGLYLVKGAFSPPRLQQLLHLVLLEYPSGTSVSAVEYPSGTSVSAGEYPSGTSVSAGEYPSETSSSAGERQLRSNLSCLGTTCSEGQSYWSMTDNQGNPLINKLRWISTGYHFDWTAREYRPGFRSPFPTELADIACRISERVGLGKELRPDSALVNYYHPGDTLAFHQDELEWDLSQPLVSVSLGLPGILCVGGTDRHRTPISILLHHGDVIILSGPSRTAYHAVPRVFDSYSLNTCKHYQGGEGEREMVGRSTPQWLELFVDGIESDRVADFDETIADIGELRKKINEFLPRTRINISIRQVEKYQ